MGNFFYFARFIPRQQRGEQMRGLQAPYYVTIHELRQYPKTKHLTEFQCKMSNNTVKNVTKQHFILTAQGMILVFRQNLRKDGECVPARWPREL